MQHGGSGREGSPLTRGATGRLLEHLCRGPGPLATLAWPLSLPLKAEPGCLGVFLLVVVTPLQVSFEPRLKLIFFKNSSIET